MALIEKRQAANSSGSYIRLFGDPDLGRLISRVHGAVIASGSELEKMISTRVKTIDDLDTFLCQEIMPEGVFLATKKMVKKCRAFTHRNSEPDFVLFRRRGGKQSCHLIELKDGHVFDTKKAQAERTAIHDFASRNGQHIHYKIQTHFCAFNQERRQDIVAGFKNRIHVDEAMTGREFCALLEIDYDEIVTMRQRDQAANRDYFLKELAAIPSMRLRLKALIDADPAFGDTDA